MVSAAATFRALPETITLLCTTGLIIYQWRKITFKSLAFCDDQLCTWYSIDLQSLSQLSWSLTINLLLLELRLIMLQLKNKTTLSAFISCFYIDKSNQQSNIIKEVLNKQFYDIEQTVLSVECSTGKFLFMEKKILVKSCFWAAISWVLVWVVVGVLVMV